MERSYYPGQGLVKFLSQGPESFQVPSPEPEPEPNSEASAPMNQVVYAESVTSGESISENRLKQENESLREEIESLKAELEFQKSIFVSHPNSAVFNLHVKKRNGQKVWVDKIKDYWDLNTLDDDPEVREWLKPIRCER